MRLGDEQKLVNFTTTPHAEEKDEEIAEEATEVTEATETVEVTDAGENK